MKQNIILFTTFDMRMTKLLFKKVRMLLQIKKTMRSSNCITMICFKLPPQKCTFINAGQPTNLSLGVKPTREGVSLKLAQLVKTQKQSPLKAQILIVHEPRSIPQIAGVDFIITKIIKKIMTLIICLIAFISILSIQCNNTDTIELYTHRWCKPCIKAKKVINKIKQKFPQIHFKEYQYSNKTILLKQGVKSTKNILPFPSIVVNCSGYKFTYQNDLTLPELTYWIFSICRNRLPTCGQWINEELFHIAVQPQKNITELVSKMQQYPHIRICQAQNANYTVQQAISILESTQQKTMFFDYFSHNVRNYLIKSQKMAIALITNNVNTSKANSFFNSYLSLIDLTQQQKNLTGNTDIIKINVQQNIKKQLIFLGLCYNKKTQRCVVDDMRKKQVIQSQKNIPKLLQFIGLQIDDKQDIEYVIAFRFKNNKFETFIYHHSLGILDQKFMFWIINLFKNEQHLQKSRQCLWNSITHRISFKSLQDIQSHLYLQKQIIKLKEQFKGNVILNKVEKIYHSQPQITLCINGKLPLHFYNHQNIQSVLRLLEQQFNSQIIQEL